MAARLHPPAVPAFPSALPAFPPAARPPPPGPPPTYAHVPLRRVLGVCVQGVDLFLFNEEATQIKEVQGEWAAHT